MMDTPITAPPNSIFFSFPKIEPVDNPCNYFHLWTIFFLLEFNCRLSYFIHEYDDDTAYITNWCARIFNANYVE